LDQNEKVPTEFYFYSVFFSPGSKPVVNSRRSYGTYTPNLVNPFYPVHPIPILISNLCNQ